jgi:thiamine biosynthesis lipoprotein
MKALALVEDLERQLTVYREDSEVSQLNQRGAHQWNRVESRLFRLLHQAVSISGETGGAFDITSGPLSKLWGFFRRDGRVPSSDDLHVVLQAVGSQWIELDQAQQAVRFTRQGVQINLGGIGKGYALDRCCELLESAGITDFLLHGGHSSVLARGARLQQPSRSGWTVAVRHPLRTEQRLLEIQLHNQALGTSGAAKQYFYHQGRRFGHILDPRTGYPADEVLAATVVAPDAATADALATGFYVLGPIQGERYVDRLGDEVAILLLVAGKRVGAIDVITWGRGELDWRMVPGG